MRVVAQGFRVRVPVHAWFAAAFWLSLAPLSPAADASPLQPDIAGTTRLAMATTSAVAAPAAESNAPATEPSNVVLIKPGRATPSISTASLTLQAWKALEKSQYDQVFSTVDQCVNASSARAQKQQASLNTFAPPERAFNYAALNDVATCLFIKGKALRELKRTDEAKAVFQEIVREYRFAQCWDPKGWFWRVASAAQDQINCIDYNLDFGDYRSETLTQKAWKAYVARRYDALEFYVRKCLELYAGDAMKMQASLGEYAIKGQESEYWALNDVATCLFIRGKALQRQGRNKEAALAYREIIDSYPFAQCWDPNGWYWKVAEEARRNLQFCG